MSRPRPGAGAALLFDMDGLLLDTERPVFEVFVEEARALGLEDAESFGLSMVGLSSSICQRLLRDYLPAEIGLERFRERWDAGVRARLAGGIPLKPGVAEVLERLTGAGWSMVVVTSTRTVTARSHLGEAGLLDHFLDVVGGDAVPANKPDPAPYLIGAERAGAHSRDCLAFEDSDAGVASALAAGCEVHQIPDIRPPDRPVPQRGQAVHRTLTDAVAAAGLLV
ncbi:HAD family hydrolase [Tropicimonas sediminicola]|uniref:Haloacid dehalogenase superfamily, subfamily IA, variant 3 with third motif having DD or ED n=1 Tax=Tropicimonas sediminicola TaxID=1031541 RepID=A0A239JY33_9RHOB|nr:HAD family phosphatase [Tropicimonas sediminicola]SNT10690.1 haloacid dehalogenase superfamily, subfamily IA, variant 3 with third motif having DD or ED [Tropicimonas sediminicola]